MYAKIAVIFCLGLAAYTSAFPASSDTELINPKYGDQPIVDTGVVSAGGFFDTPFDIVQSMENMMRRMREQMNAFLGNFGSSANGTSITDVDDLSGFGFPSIPDLDLGKGNTTSVTKIINGQKVVINETRYGKENENGGAFFKVRVIEVKPDQNSTTTTIPRDVESVENSQENEIQKKAENEAQYRNIESFDDIDNTIPRSFTPLSLRWNNPEDFDAENRIDGPLVQPMKPYDLSRDIYVNKLLADRGYPRNPDAEFIGSNQAERFDQGNDLSRDIWVNQLMADQGVAPNPDAEVFERNAKQYEKFINPR